MAEITINGQTVNTIGELPKVGEKAPDFILTGTDLNDLSLKDVAGKKVILNIFPSIDTPVCSTSARKFNEAITKFSNAVVICASCDLPFAHARFCEAEGLENIIPASQMRNTEFGNTYGVRMVDGPLAGLFARAVVVINENGKVMYSKMVQEIKNEPNYDEVLDALQQDTDNGKNICMQPSTAENVRISNSDDPCDDGREG